MLVIVAVIIILVCYYLYGVNFEAVLKASRKAENLVNNFRSLYLGVLGLGTAIGLSFLFISVVLKKRWILYICVVLSLIVLFLTMFILSHKIPVEMMYQLELARYSYIANCCTNNSLSCIWNFTKSIADEFNATYGASIAKPRELLRLPFVDTDEVSKLAAIAKTGACFDFALGIARVLNDLGCPARIVEVRGVDHAVPEVMIGNEWYVIDALYTTRNQPVEASQWASYLVKNRPRCFNAIAKLTDMSTGMDITAQHGFNTSLVTIKAIIDPTARKGNEVPAREARILIFVPSSSGLYRTLVYLGTTNDEGLATVELVADRGYIVFVEQGGFVGVEHIYIPGTVKFFNITIPMYATGAKIMEEGTRIAQTVTGAIIGIVGAVIGAITTIFLRDFVERRKKPILHVAKLSFYRFKSSARLYLVIQNKGRRAARNSVAYLTISLYKDGTHHTRLPRKMLPPKSTFATVENRLVPKSWDYLVPEHDDFSIVKEALPWATPKEFGRGLDGDPYQHVTDIPAKGFNRILLMDIYKVENKCYVLRVFSEYGTEAKPRAIIVLPLTQKTLFEKLVFEIHITCDDVRREGKAKIEIVPKDNDYVVYFNGKEQFMLNEITRDLKEDIHAKTCCKAIISSQNL
ncbi:MAG: hypothetical protein DRJ18_02085 [Candidatus Methanomethylicota archaeon]|nr:MAG: hypothetical protein DRJ18_02085 [Candidatus Verstraetearchaeota archaeon]